MEKINVGRTHVSKLTTISTATLSSRGIWRTRSSRHRHWGLAVLDRLGVLPVQPALLVLLHLVQLLQKPKRTN